MKIAILALDGVFDTGLSVLLDTFAIANNLGANNQSPATPFEVEVVGVRRRVHTGRGLLVPVAMATRSPQPDWVVLPALSPRPVEQLIPALARRDVADAAAQLRAWHAGGARIATACAGSFVLAESGLLDGQTATTTWWLGPLFRQRYPAAQLDVSRMIVPSGRVVTAGTGMGHLDLALWLLNQVSPDLAAIVARYMIVDERSSQAPYIIPDHLARADPVVERFERWARGRLSEGFSLDEAADVLAIGKRTLQRRIESVLGKSPLSYFQDLRIERAVHLVRTSRLDIEAIAAEVGYAGGATLRSLLRKRLGKGVRELRGESARHGAQ
jgi:transcriptional regulator GlxA family with amidase domain